MPEIARIRWQSPPPTAIDEELTVNEDGTALLVIRTSRDRSPAIGTWRATVDAEDRAALEGQIREVDLTSPVPEDAVITVAERVAAAARQQPLATVTFYAAALPAGGVALQAVGAGHRSAAFELDVDSTIMHLERDGSEIGWQAMEPLLTGFVSPEPAGLGGVGRPAEIAPGAYGTIALSGPMITEAGAVAIEVSGVLRDETTDGRYGRFTVRTAAVPIPG